MPCWRDLDGAEYIVKSVGHAREEAQPGRAVHYFHPAAGILAQAALQREAHHDAGAALYEGVETGQGRSVGLITYMRTDSTRISDDAVDRGRGITSADRYGTNICPSAQRLQVEEGRAGRPRSHPPHFRHAHRPKMSAPFLAEDQIKLYRLIWKRFVLPR